MNFALTNAGINPGLKAERPRNVEVFLCFTKSLYLTLGPSGKRWHTAGPSARSTTG